MGKFNNEDNGYSRGDNRGDSRGGRPPFRGGRGGRGGGSQGGRGPPRGIKVYVQPHRLPGVYVARGPKDALVTKNLVPGESVYNEKRISV